MQDFDYQKEKSKPSSNAENVASSSFASMMPPDLPFKSELGGLSGGFLPSPASMLPTPSGIIGGVWSIIKNIMELVATGGGDLMADLIESFITLGEDYELAADLVRWYLVQGQGRKFDLYVPDDWAQLIFKNVKRSKKDVSSYNWGNGDMRNGLGHFNVDITNMPGGMKMYRITDHYHFPANVKGKKVFHAFQIPTAIMKEINTHIGVANINLALATLGTYTRKDGTQEVFKIDKSNQLVVPQAYLMDNGTPFDIEGVFFVDANGQIHGSDPKNGDWM